MAGAGADGAARAAAAAAYIERHDAPKPEDRERYQTVYARDDGSVAAPTAGLHFTPELLARLAETRSRGALPDAARGAGHVPADAGRAGRRRIAWRRSRRDPRGDRGGRRRAKRAGRRVVAVGTTTTRALEWAAGEDGRLRAGPGAADLFIRPGHRFRVVDALVTNFHLPRSTLLVLVAALAGAS